MMDINPVFRLTEYHISYILLQGLKQMRSMPTRGQDAMLNGFIRSKPTRGVVVLVAMMCLGTLGAAPAEANFGAYNACVSNDGGSAGPLLVRWSEGTYALSPGGWRCFGDQSDMGSYGLPFGSPYKQSIVASQIGYLQTGLYDPLGNNARVDVIVMCRHVV
jgi:hypothetical protein